MATASAAELAARLDRLGVDRQSKADEEVRFALDSPLEQAGFELPVPLATVSI